MTEKIWYILFEDEKDGPFDIWDLKHNARVTPDTLAWRLGFDGWVPIRNIPELKKIFEDAEENKDVENKTQNPTVTDELTLSLQKDPRFYFLIWFLLLLFIAIWLFYHLFY